MISFKIHLLFFLIEIILKAYGIHPPLVKLKNALSFLLLITTLEIEILKKFYCENMNINKMTFMFHYSRAQLYRYKSNAEKKLNN